MDFMKLLKSIEELLYELITWFVFYPLTFWRIVTRPISMLAYAQKELTEKDHEQFDDAVSPPILLLLTLVLLHVLEGAVAGRAPSVFPTLLQDDRNLLVFRALAFSLFPLLFATMKLRNSGARMTRTTLKPAFYSQSYATVPFVMAISLGMQLSSHAQALPGGSMWGLMVALAGTIWYLAVETVWLSKGTQMSRLRAVLATLGIFLVAVFVLLVAAALVALVGYQMDQQAPTP
ncbi:hypothetical protein DEVEQU_00770 [Devosia equisanguinis]|uniref:Permease n=1 Tax=Devosia equisanguinis TaxID=2490941 RepID=A0A3S4CBV3_9HYPH|nr:hypothetical protein [Devosia equisanguinis]VDS03643.1 hypothetical protein DEVEQU_00770 [Devosia equisanguinis]